jgi:ATP-dependent RNA helicase DeaD
MTDIIEEQSDTKDLFTGSFEDFALSPELMLGLKDLGYTKPTHVQRAVFEPVKSGRDLIVQSHTGSGKTTAFCLPLLAILDPNVKAPQAIVLVPTRELARQVAIECGRIAHHCNLRVAAIYGGASFEAQTAALKAGAQVVVGTPGRVKDLFERRILDVSQIKISVLDEADEMLSAPCSKTPSALT